MRQKVAITGIGILSPIGNTIHDVLESLMEGRSGISAVEDLELTPAHTFLRTSIDNFISKA